MSAKSMIERNERFYDERFYNVEITHYDHAWCAHVKLDGVEVKGLISVKLDSQPDCFPKITLELYANTLNYNHQDTLPEEEPTRKGKA